MKVGPNNIDKHNNNDKLKLKIATNINSVDEINWIKIKDLEDEIRNIQNSIDMLKTEKNPNFNPSNNVSNNEDTNTVFLPLPLIFGIFGNSEPFDFINAVIHDSPTLKYKAGTSISSRLIEIGIFTVLNFHNHIQRF